MYRIDLYYMQAFESVLSDSTRSMMNELMEIDGFKREVITKENSANNENHLYGYLTDEQATYYQLRHPHLYVFATKCAHEV
jgi:hypothetical protein